MFLRIDQFLFLLGMNTPKQKYDVVLLNHPANHSSNERSVYVLGRSKMY
jgi:hypothetical protein